MFLKVFKYDFKAIFFKFLPILAIFPVIAVIIRIMSLMNIDGVFVGMIWGALNGLFILGFVLISFYTLVICIMRYTKSLFRDQGYLTHTLPVNKHQLLLSQILADVLMEFISVLVVVLCFFIAYYRPSLLASILTFINEILEIFIPVEKFYNIFGGTIVLFVFSIIFSFLQNLFVIYTGIAIGHSFPKNKGILSVVFCIAINYGLGFFTGIASLIVGVLGDFVVLNPSDFARLANHYLLINIIESILICVGAYFFDIYLMKNKLNLE
ncbi:MAG: hypothetical protein K2K48_06050 [Anaeroplasmataceae bacterium]|nr:hypothetical protein [Anaeroplasmataceae bacterium]MDE6414958.1 hypothetical protein [Anaeroplasmataceae bacterium]